MLASVAMMFPVRYCRERSPTKKSRHPMTLIGTDQSSRRVARSPRISGPSIITHTGARFCKKMAFPAVVSLFAKMNRNVVAAYDKLPATKDPFRRKGGLFSQTHKTRVAENALPNTICAAVQEQSLIVTPPVDQTKADNKIAARPRGRISHRWFIKVLSRECP